MKALLSGAFRVSAMQDEAYTIGREVFHPVERTDRPLGRALTVWSHAGGSGKSTLTRDLAYEMVRRGYRVLVIDADPQANLTMWLGHDPVSVPKESTLLHLVQEGSVPQPLPVGFGTPYPVLDLVPANTFLALAEIAIPSKPSGMLLLRGQIRAYRERYDFIFMDSPPSLGALAGLVALAGDGLLVPVETSAKGFQALHVVLDVSADYARTLVSLGFQEADYRFVRMVVPTRYDPRTTQDRRAQELLHTWLAERAQIPVAPTITYRPSPYKRAIDAQLPVRIFADAHLAEELDALADFFLSTEGVPAPSFRIQPKGEEVAL